MCARAEAEAVAVLLALAVGDAEGLAVAVLVALAEALALADALAVPPPVPPALVVPKFSPPRSPPVLVSVGAAKATDAVTSTPIMVRATNSDTFLITTSPLIASPPNAMLGTRRGRGQGRANFGEPPFHALR